MTYKQYAPLIEPEPWLKAYLNDAATLREAAEIAGVSHEQVANRLRMLGIPVRSRAETSSLRLRLAVERHGDAIRESFLAERSIDATSSQVDVPKDVVTAYLEQYIPDYKVLTRAPRKVEKNYTSEELVASLLEGANRVAGNLSHEAYKRFVDQEPLLSDGRQRPGPQAMAIRFSTWNGALLAAGLPANPSAGPPKKFSDPVVVLESLVACWQELSRPPSVLVYDRWQRGKEAHPSSATARHLLGSWDAALIRAWQIVYGIRLNPDDIDISIPSSLVVEAPQFRPYSSADEEVVLNVAVDELQTRIPELQTSIRNHALLQNLLAQALQTRGRIPLSPCATDVKFDIAFLDRDSSLVVAEVKSCNPTNLENQLRLGLGQILRYAHRLRQEHKVVRSVLVTQLEPPDDWKLLLSELEVESLHQGELKEGLINLLRSE